MKKTFFPLLALIAATALYSGCSWQVGGGKKSEIIQPTVGQQLIDLRKARDAGAISEPEYQAEKARVLAGQ